MARIKRAVTAHKKRRKVLKLAKGYFGAKSKQYRTASESSFQSKPCGVKIGSMVLPILPI